MHARTSFGRILGALVLVTLALAVPAMASAQQVIPAPGLGSNSAWTVYAFGNAQAVSQAFRAIYNFTSSYLFRSAISLVALCGVLVVGLTGGFNPGMGKRFIGYVVGVFITVYMFWGYGNGPLVVQIEVEDTVDGTWVAPVTVPAIVGIPAALISTGGYEITQQIEASFSALLPEGLQLSHGAPFDLAASMIADASKARITDPNLASSMSYYVQDCTIPAIVQGSLSAQTLITSTDFINDIKPVNMNGVYVNTFLGGTAPDGTTRAAGSPNVVTCTDAWTLINTALTANGSDAAAFLKNASAWATTPALNVVNSAFDSVASYSTNNGITDGGAMVKQAAVLAAFSDAYRQTAATTGSSDFVTALAMNQASEQQQTGWFTSAEIFNRTMGYIYSLLQVFVYCLTPFMLGLVLIPGLGLAMMKSFGQVLLWLAIWQPMLAIVNFIVLTMQQGDLAYALTSTNGYGFTLASLGVVSQKATNMRAAAMFIGPMVPLLAWGMVKGSLDFSRIVGGAMGEHVASQAAATMVTGNYSLNSASADSFTANKQSIGHTGDYGYGYSATGQGGTNHRVDQGGWSVSANGQNASITPSSGMGITDSGGVGRQAASTQSSARQMQAVMATGMAVGAAIGEMASHMHGGTVSDSLGLGGQWSNGIGGRKGGGGGGSVNGPGAGQPGTVDAKAAAAMESRMAAMFGGALRAAMGQFGVSASGDTRASTQDGYNSNDSSSKTTTGTRSQTGSTSLSSSIGNSVTDSAQDQHGWQTGSNLQMTGLASESQQFGALSRYRHSHSAYGNMDLTPGGGSSGRTTYDSMAAGMDNLPGSVGARQGQAGAAMGSIGAAERKGAAAAAGAAGKISKDEKAHENIEAMRYGNDYDQSYQSVGELGRHLPGHAVDALKTTGEIGADFAKRAGIFIENHVPKQGDNPLEGNPFVGPYGMGTF